MNKWMWACVVYGHKSNVLIQFNVFPNKQYNSLKVYKDL